MSHTPSLVSRATRATEVDEMDDDFVRQNDATVKVINFIEKFEHLKSKINENTEL